MQGFPPLSAVALLRVCGAGAMPCAAAWCQGLQVAAPDPTNRPPRRLHYPKPGFHGEPVGASMLWGALASLGALRQQQRGALPQMVWMDTPPQVGPRWELGALRASAGGAAKRALIQWINGAARLAPPTAPPCRRPPATAL